MNPFSMLSDEELMAKYKLGESEAFDVLYSRFHQKVYAYLGKRLASQNAVDEVFQNVFLKFHKQRNNYNSDYAVSKWVFTIARSELYDFCKKKKVEVIEFDENNHGEQQDTKEELDLSSLSSREREAIEGRYFKDLEYEEIAKDLNIAPANARKVISRAMTKLRKKFLTKD
ncbi:sigma-70 family RNA polymerase sigma factor [Halobacteriovorax sp. GB3]|uniref:RNA polymerase sigma factor n=1 Tax=Halobacteriovorax sp. GB3 TaxID=2719615 RepID=UPI00235F38C9|nr:sigma-70 family RNA polymerase sigma factor [Halobacteriovorax sp. GB3]MDD0851820.1 sigma-70 family RNA polymerase sigma factor [Halobacteriovorax sp. GB3]